MRINVMTDYAVRIIKRIAQSESGLVTSKYIAEKEQIPHGVLMNVLRRLRENHFVVSHQGRGEISGGYSLGMPVKEVTLLDIIEVMEGPIQFHNMAVYQDENFIKHVKEGKDIQYNKERKMKNNGAINIGDISRYNKGKNHRICAEYIRVSSVLRNELKRYSLHEIINA